MDVQIAAYLFVTAVSPVSSVTLSSRPPSPTSTPTGQQESAQNIICVHSIREQNMVYAWLISAPHILAASRPCLTLLSRDTFPVSEIPGCAET